MQDSASAHFPVTAVLLRKPSQHRWLKVSWKLLGFLPGLDETTLQQFLTDIENSAGNTATRYRRKIRGLLHLVMTLPQYQLK